MGYSSNIQINSDFLNSDKVSIHNRKLEIASLNLDNYNSKFDNHICKLIYNSNDLEFYPLNKDDKHSIFITSQINYFTWWDLQTDTYKNDMVNTYIHNIYNMYYQKVYSIISFNLIISRSVKSDLDWFFKERDLFKLRFKNSHPIGFLSVEQELKIKTEFNRLCQELDDLIKSPKQS